MHYVGKGQEVIRFFAEFINMTFDLEDSGKVLFFS